MNPFLTEYEIEQADEHLIRQALEGEKEALEDLLRKHQPYIYNIAWKMVQNPDDAADLTQEALIKIMTKLSKFNFKSSFRTWAYRIVVNHFLNEKKKRGGENYINSFEELGAGLDSIPNEELSHSERQEHKEAIREMNLRCMSGMLLCLNREQRLVYIIGEMFGGNHNIGAEIMEMSQDNFRAKLRKARKDLYSFMNQKCGLVNKDNPCRCRKKVKFAMRHGQIDAKKLLQNRKEYASFQKEIAADADHMYEQVDHQYAELFRQMTFKNDFDRQTFIEKILEDMDWKNRLRLN